MIFLSLLKSVPILRKKTGRLVIHLTANLISSLTLSSNLLTYMSSVIFYTLVFACLLRAALSIFPDGINISLHSGDVPPAILQQDSHYCKFN